MISIFCNADNRARRKSTKDERKWGTCVNKWKIILLQCEMLEETKEEYTIR